MPYIITFLVFLLFAIQSKGQSNDTTWFNIALKKNQNVLHQFINEQAEIYNGTEYIPHSPSIKGTPFFASPDWQIGSILYNDVLYNNVKLKYDLVRNELLILHPNDQSIISLYTPRVKEFYIGENKFVYLKDAGIQPGFYNQLNFGKATVFVKRTKWIDEKEESKKLERSFLDQHQYFVLLNNKYHTIKKPASIVDLFKEHKKEIQKHLKGTGLKFKKEPEKALIAVADYYNSIN